MQILAWITEENGRFVACYVSNNTLDRPPATHVFSSKDGARAWVYFEAELLGVPVKWLDRCPR